MYRRGRRGAEQVRVGGDDLAEREHPRLRHDGGVIRRHQRLAHRRPGGSSSPYRASRRPPHGFSSRRGRTTDTLPATSPVPSLAMTTPLALPAASLVSPDEHYTSPQRDPSFHGGRDANHTRNGRAATPPGGGSNFWAVIPAGGSGTRLLAAEPGARPKFCCHCSDSNRCCSKPMLDTPGSPSRAHSSSSAAGHAAAIVASSPSCRPRTSSSSPHPTAPGRRWRWRPR